MVEYYWLDVVIIRWLSAASAWRRAKHNAKKSSAGNVPFFHPGSGLAVRHAWISGCWSHPTGQAACEREPGSGGRGGEGRRILDLLNAKWVGTNPESGFVSVVLLRSRNQWFMSDFLQVTKVQTGLCSLCLKCCIKHVASKTVRLYRGLKLKKEKKENSLPAKSTDSSPHLTVLLLPPRPHY